MRLCVTRYVLLIFFLTTCRLMGQHLGRQPIVSSHTLTITANSILNRLYQSSGYTLKQLPNIRISTGQQSGAWYKPHTNEIWIETHLFDICREFGQDSTVALAFILAHELSHAFTNQGNLHSMNFLHYRRNHTSKASAEYEADLQGSFICYQAGFQPHRVLTLLLEKIYLRYGISKEDGLKYPKMAVRQNSAQQVLAVAEPLAHLFDLSNVFMMNGQYHWASACLNWVGKYFQATEVLNNLGICHALQAMQWEDPILDQYAYPLELDLNTGLKKIKKARGDLQEEFRIKRNQLLQKALSCFNQSLAINHEYLISHANIMSVYCLSGNPEKAVRHYQLNRKTVPGFSNDSGVKLALAIAMALQKEVSASKLLGGLCNVEDAKLSKFALFNAQVYSFQREPNPGPVECKGILETQHESGMKKDTTHMNWDGIPMSLVYSSQNGLKDISLLQDDIPLYRMKWEVFNPAVHKFPATGKNFSYASNISWMVGKRGNYLLCNDSGVIYLLNEDQVIQESIQLLKFTREN